MCYPSIAQGGDYQALAGATESLPVCTICYLALMASVNKQTNQKMLALLQASWPFVMVTGMGGNSSVTVKDGKIFKVPKMLDRNAFTADSLHVLHSWQ